MKKLSAVLLLAAVGATSVVADTVYVTSTCSNATSTTVCGSAINPDYNANGVLVYTDSSPGFTSAVSTKPDGPLTPGARYFSNSFSNSTPDIEGITINPVLQVTGGVYRLYHVFSSAAGNVSSTIVVGATNVSGCTLNFNQTPLFQATYGAAVSGKNVYQLLGYVTNNLDTSSPTIRFYFVGGVVSAVTPNRLVVDTFKLALDNPCLNIPVVGVTGPLATNLAAVVVTGVTNTATKITVYQDSGSGMTQIGSLSTGIVNGNNNVPVSGLVKGAQVAATQTINGQEGCMPTAGTVVGGGGNPAIRFALSIRECPSSGPAGAPGISTNTAIHFLGASTVSGGAPTDSMILYPSNGWQTVTFAGKAGASSPSNAVGSVADFVDSGYSANDTVAIQVYAYRTVPATGLLVYSATPAQSATITSNGVFIVNWSWDPAPNADGYQVLRNVNGGGYNEFANVGATTTFMDANNGWSPGNTVTPNLVQSVPSVQWNPASTTPPLNSLTSRWAILEAVALTIADTTDTGPFDLYIDNIQSGTNAFQTFETVPANTTDYGFRVPSFSGTTSGNILGAPNVGQVANNAADTGTKSFHVQFQWQTPNATRWVRLTTSAVNNPQVDMDQPISMRVLFQPPGATPPTPPPSPTLAVSTVAGKTVLNWTGGHRLQTSVNVTGTYTNTTQVRSANTWTNITLGAFLSPWTNSFTEPTRFFRLRD
jgi:hypothetical protein